MASMIQIYSIGLATLEAILIYKLSRYPGVTSEYAASIVGYNMISLMTMYSVASPSFTLYTEPITLLVLLLTFAGLAAITIDGLLPPVKDERIDRVVKGTIRFGMVLAVVSVLLLAFPESVDQVHQL